MFIKLVLLFLALPFIEIAILVHLGSQIGFWPTILIQIGTGVVGASLARWQGFWIWRKIQLELANGVMPADNMIEGLLILAAGIVLLTPGLLTDALGFLVLIPWTRRWIKRWLQNKMDKMRMQHHGDAYYLLK